MEFIVPLFMGARGLTASGRRKTGVIQWLLPFGKGIARENIVDHTPLGVSVVWDTMRGMPDLCTSYRPSMVAKTCQCFDGPKQGHTPETNPATEAEQ